MTRRYCLALDLKDDAGLIAEYERYHQEVWPEITRSIRESGIEDMEIYRVGDRLFMVMEVSDDFSFEAKADADRANPRVQEWEALMGQCVGISDILAQYGKTAQQQEESNLWARYASVEEMINDLDKIEYEADKLESQINNALYVIEKSLNPIDAVFLYRVIHEVGEVADIAQRVGARVELLLAR